MIPVEYKYQKQFHLICSLTRVDKKLEVFHCESELVNK